MNVQAFIQKNKEMYNQLINFIDEENGSDEDYSNLINLLNIQDKKEELKEILHLLANITTNHHRSPVFFNKIELIIINYRESIKQKFSNLEIFNIFKDNKRILLFLIKEQLFNIDQNISYIIFGDDKYSKQNYPSYFYPELKKLQYKSTKDQESYFETVEKMISENPELFERNRLLGENEKDLCEIIRKDSIDDFLKYQEQKRISLIKPSIFETHSILKDKSLTPIEYSVFFGSYQIFSYLISQKVEVTSSIWKYAIHSQNLKIIQILEQNDIFPETNSCEELLKESIKCHHNDIAEYIMQKYMPKESKNDNSNLFSFAIKYHNYHYLPSDFSNDFLFYKLCKYDHITLVSLVMNEVNVNKVYSIKKNIEKLKKVIEKEKTPLYVATERGNSEIVNLLLSQENIDINKKLTTKCTYFYKDEIYERSALHIAIEKRNFQTAKILLNSNKIDVNAKTNYKIKKSGYNETQEKSPLYLSVENEAEEVVQSLLLHENIEINAKFLSNEIGTSTKYYLEKSPLFLAIEKGLENIASILLMNPKTDVNSQMTKSYEAGKFNSLKKEAPIHLAISNNELNCFNQFLKREDIDLTCLKIQKFNLWKKIEEKVLTPLQIAIIKGRTSMVKALLEKQNIDINNVSKIVKHEFDNKTMKTMFSNGYKYLIIDNQRTALHFAVENNDLEIVKLLLERPDIDANKKKIFSFSTINNTLLGSDIEQIRGALETLKKERDEKKKIENNEEEEETVQIEGDGEQHTLESKMINEQSALHLAIKNNNFDIVEALIGSQKIDINSVSTNNFNGYFIEEERAEKEVIKYTDLHIAAELGTPEIIELIASQKEIDINAKHIEESESIKSVAGPLKYGWKKTVEKTAIHIAIEENISENAKALLINKELDINSILLTKYHFIEVLNERDEKTEQTPLFLSIVHEMPDISEILLRREDIDVNQHSSLDENSSQTNLFLAIHKGMLGVIKLLLDRDDLDVNSISTLYSKDNGKTTIIETSSLHNAVKTENVEIVRLLLSRHDIDVNFKEKHFELIQRQINSFYTIKSKKLANEYPILNIAILTENCKIIELLLEQQNLDINAKSLSYDIHSGSILTETPPLHTTVRIINSDVLQLLLSNQRIDKDAVDEKGRTLAEYFNDITDQLKGGGEEEEEEENKNDEDDENCNIM